MIFYLIYLLYETYMKTDIRLLQNTNKYRKTLKWVITNIYSHQKSRSINRWFSIWYSLKELQEWCSSNDKFVELYYKRLENPTRWNKPSIDRKNCFYWYTFDNIQVMTSLENKIKWDKEKEVIRWKPITQYDIYGNKVKDYKSIKQAVKETWCWQWLISSCLSWKRNHTWWFIWKYQNPELLSDI